MIAMRSYRSILCMTAASCTIFAPAFAADFGNVKGGFDPSAYIGAAPASFNGGGTGSNAGASGAAGSTNSGAANSGGANSGGVNGGGAPANGGATNGGTPQNSGPGDVTNAVPGPANSQAATTPFSLASADRSGNKGAGKVGSSSSGGDFIEAATFGLGSF